jgi:phosphate transport system permease protein
MATQAESAQSAAYSPPRQRSRNTALSETLPRVMLLVCAGVVVLSIVAIFGFIAQKGLTTFIKDGVSPIEFFTHTRWVPQSKNPGYGAFPIILGSLLVTGLALLISTPLSVCAAMFMADIGPARIRGLLQPVVEVFVGIPSVVYGFLGLKLLVPFIRTHVGGLGFSLLAGSLVLAIMTLPTITGVATDSLRHLPVSLKEAAYGLGATRWQTMGGVLLPAARAGILTGVVLGTARAIGEALAVQMVIGNNAHIPTSLTDTVATLTSIITLNMGNTSQGTTWNNTLWTMALVLLMISLAMILIIRRLGSREVAQ